MQGKCNNIPQYLHSNNDENTERVFQQTLQ